MLCWHQLRDREAGDDEYSRNILICPPENFREQLDAIADDGWTPIDADRYLEHLTTGRDLPDKSVLLTFDERLALQSPKLVSAPKKSHPK